MRIGYRVHLYVAAIGFTLCVWLFLRNLVMRLRHLFAALAACLVLAAPLAFAQQFSSVEERMSSQQFKEAGLDKLSPEELAKLNAFIRNEVNVRTAQAHEAGAREQNKNDAGRIGFKDYYGERGEVVSRIPGTFKGWHGGTVFTLENGQVWRQIDSTELAGVNIENAVVHITPSLVGNGWFLQVEGYGSYTKVERVQ